MKNKYTKLVASGRCVWITKYFDGEDEYIVGIRRKSTGAETMFRKPELLKDSKGEVK